MFCKKCGTENPENALFCKSCGSSLINLQSDNQTEQQAYTSEKYSSNPVINLIKKLASSPMFLVGAILYTVYAFFGFINAASMDMVTNYLVYVLKMSEGITDTLSGLTGPLTVLSYIGMIPTLLIAVAIWLIYTAGKDTLNDTMKTTGITIIKVVTIIQLIFLCVGCTVSIAGLVFMIAFLHTVPNLTEDVFGSMSFNHSYDAHFPEEFGINFVVLFCVIYIIVLIITLIVGLVFNISALKTINSIKNSLENGKPAKKISMFLIIMMFVLAASNLMVPSIAGLCLAAAYVIFAIVLLNLRKEMAELPSGYNDMEALSNL